MSAPLTGKWLRDLIKQTGKSKYGVTVKQVAAKANMTQTGVHHQLSGRNSISPAVAHAIAELTHVDAYSIVIHAAQEEYERWLDGLD